MKTIEITSQVFNVHTNKPVHFKVIDVITEENVFDICFSDSNEDIIKKYESYSFVDLKINEKVKVLLIEWKS